MALGRGLDVGRRGVTRRVLRQEGGGQQRKTDRRRQRTGGLAHAEVRQAGQQQMIEDAGIGEIAEAHADTRQDRQRAQDLHDAHDRHEVSGIAEARERLPDPRPLGDVQESGGQVEQRQKRRADPVDISFSHEVVPITVAARNIPFVDCVDGCESALFFCGPSAHIENVDYDRRHQVG